MDVGAEGSVGEHERVERETEDRKRWCLLVEEKRKKRETEKKGEGGRERKEARSSFGEDSIFSP